MADLLVAALELSCLGLHTFSCRGKQPATPRGVLAATDDPDALARMWRDHPGDSIAIAAGASGLVIVDVDGDEGRASLTALVEQRGQLPRTPSVRTGRGWHLYFAAPLDVALGPTAGKLGSKVDTRAGRSYVIAPPSPHASGRPYQWVRGRRPDEIPLAPLPTWMLEALKPREPECCAESAVIDRERIGAYAHKALSAECAVVVSAPLGGRNAQLNTSAFSIGQLVGAGVLDAGLARGALIEAGRRAGLGTRETILTANSGLSAGMAQPRRLAS